MPPEDHGRKLVDSTINAIEELLEAKKIVLPVTTQEKQRKTALERSPRCRRCGKIVVALIGNPPFCGACVDRFMELDKADTGKILWFVEMIDRLNNTGTAPVQQVDL